MTTDRPIIISAKEARELGALCTRDEAGRHFYQWADVRRLRRWERTGLIRISRPIHETGIPYAEEFHSIEVSGAVAGWFDDRGGLLQDIFPLTWRAER